MTGNSILLQYLMTSLKYSLKLNTVFILINIFKLLWLIMYTRSQVHCLMAHYQVFLWEVWWLEWEWSPESLTRLPSPHWWNSGLYYQRRVRLEVGTEVSKTYAIPLMIRHSNLWAYGDHSFSNHHNFLFKLNLIKILIHKRTATTNILKTILKQI